MVAVGAPQATKADCSIATTSLVVKVRKDQGFQVGPAEIMNNRRTKNKLVFLSGLLLIFSAAMAIMYYAMH